MAIERQAMPKSFPLRLSRTVFESAKAAAEADGISMNHFIEIALAEKLTRIHVGEASHYQ